MIEHLTFRFGTNKKKENLKLDLTPITVIVGPNNSGKSRVLIEIENYCRQGNSNQNDLVLESLVFSSYSQRDIEEEIEKIQLDPILNDRLGPGDILIGKVSAQANRAIRYHIRKNELVKQAMNPNRASDTYRLFLDLFTLRLDGTNRLSLLKEQDAGDLLKTPENHLAHLFLNNKLRSEVSRITYEAFGKYYVIDPTKIGKLRVRLSERLPFSEYEEKGWDEESVKFHRAAVEIINTSDGVKAFCGIVTTILAGDPKIILIDEPEAFLHPALSNKLGKEIGRSLRDTNKRLFVSTHSSSFLMGCIQSGSPLNIVRLTYKNNVATARVLPQQKLLHLMRHPLLRSTGILNGLFFESVIVCEADSDRAFYQEINERLLSSADKRGINNCLFINAQNKQTVWEIVKPLRELGIPAVGIVDIDILKEGGAVFSKPLEGAFIPTLSHTSYHAQRASLLNSFLTTQKNMKRDGGIELLGDDAKKSCNDLFDLFKDYGIFIVKNGELESWLNVLSIAGHGSTWLINILTRLGENPNEPDYVKPSIGDVWDFIGDIKKWIENPIRKGIPD
jgi:energy-coupling factor transporter ATP-binding protein EcfA2